MACIINRDYLIKQFESGIKFDKRILRAKEKIAQVRERNKKMQQLITCTTLSQSSQCYSPVNQNEHVLPHS